MEEISGLGFRGIRNLFNLHHTKSTILKAEEDGAIPTAKRVPYGKRKISQRIWDYSQVAEIGERYGFLSKPSVPTVVTLFSTKGGILKSTLALNIARLYALHNVKTIVIDLDPQADTTRNLGLDISEDSVESLEEVNNMLSSIKSLFDLFQNEQPISDIIFNTDLPTLDLIPSHSAIIPLMEILNTNVRREYQFEERLVAPLKGLGYELIIFDNAPSWSIFSTNAIASADILISPLECKIAHYRNTPEFVNYLDSFLKTMNLKSKVSRLFVPVKTSGTRKLATQIKQFFHQNIENCSNSSIRESIIGEEAIAMKKSILEYSHRSTLSEDMREFLIELNSMIAPKH